MTSCLKVNAITKNKILFAHTPGNNAHIYSIHLRYSPYTSWLFPHLLSVRLIKWYTFFSVVKWDEEMNDNTSLHSIIFSSYRTKTFKKQNLKRKKAMGCLPRKSVLLLFISMFIVCVCVIYWFSIIRFPTPHNSLWRSQSCAINLSLSSLTHTKKNDLLTYVCECVLISLQWSVRFTHTVSHKTTRFPNRTRARSTTTTERASEQAREGDRERGECSSTALNASRRPRLLSHQKTRWRGWQ